MKIQLFADSACDLHASYFSQEELELIPLKVHINGNEYEDLIGIDAKELYKEIRSGEVPKTSQASPVLLEQKFTQLAESGKSGIYIAFSSELSGTYQTAVMIRDQVKETLPTLDLTIIDSKCASLGYGLVVKEALKAINSNLPKEEIVELAKEHANSMEHLFTVEDLDYLAKGGRVSKASAFVGGLLNIKPLLHVEDGKLIPLEKLRGKKSCLLVYLTWKREARTLINKPLGLVHGDHEELAQEMKTLIQERFQTTEFEINMIGSAVGSHSGPGTLAIFFLNKR
ncbi:DegV domain-containing protein YitS [Bacillus coahuilensis m2-6]|uniref:DegV family protein n=1 Tax=Bacillus coahuilensis TaxID=408580 RepID=UPI000750082A|nr:DegV family protein [Bacillus coahuilensis]KUP09058.1 DegV domain-containing protein YitS [Bacillus coahuilensis m2-6]